ncbi:MAG: pyridoxal phosphate-dependent aminotransferase [Candidatus Aminicenantes bacterium]|nr:pyridoxal phosphate-dependent aminotransferase [Candidatus Aminicenantes bacterium]
MDFKPIKYMEWVKNRGHAQYDLCPSGVSNLSLKELGIDREDLEIFGENSYGYLPLIQAIANRYRVHEDNVMLSVGTSHALFLVCALLLKRGDVVLVEKPAYEPLWAVAQAFGGRIVRLYREYEQGYTFNLDELEKNLSENVKFVLLTNLHNPSGVSLSPSLLKDMADLTNKKGVYLIVDEVYLEFLDGELGQTSFHLADNIIVISSLTKVFGLAGLRCGWILAPPEIVAKMKIFLDYSLVEGVFISELISSKMFDRLDSIKLRKKERIHQNMNLTKAFIESESRLTWIEPSGGIICFPRVESGLSGDDLARILRKDFDTAVIPGGLFESPQHFRLGMDVEPLVMTEVLENIKKVLA